MKRAAPVVLAACLALAACAEQEGRAPSMGFGAVGSSVDRYVVNGDDAALKAFRAEFPDEYRAMVGKIVDAAYYESPAEIFGRIIKSELEGFLRDNRPLIETMPDPARQRYLRSLSALLGREIDRNGSRGCDAAIVAAGVQRSFAALDSEEGALNLIRGMSEARVRPDPRDAPTGEDIARFEASAETRAQGLNSVSWRTTPWGECRRMKLLMDAAESMPGDGGGRIRAALVARLSRG